MNAEALAHILITFAASQALRNVTHSMFLNTLQNNSPKHHKHHTQTAYHTHHTYAAPYTYHTPSHRGPEKQSLSLS